MRKPGVVIIINAVIWGLVIIGCSIALRETGAYKYIQNILIGGSFVSMLFLARFEKKSKSKLDT